MFIRIVLVFHQSSYYDLQVIRQFEIDMSIDLLHFTSVLGCFRILISIVLAALVLN